MKQEIKVIPMFRTNDFERNYGRLNGDVEYCICCGRKLNPKTMKMAQALAPGYFVDVNLQSIPERITETEHQEPMGWYPVGPVCYREIRRRLEKTTDTVIVEI